MDQQQQMQQAMHIWAKMAPILIIFWVVKMALYIIPLYRIARRAGVSPGIAFIAALPFIGRMLALYVMAFTEWRVAPLATSVFPPPYPTGPAFAPPAPPAYPPTSFTTADYPSQPAGATHEPLPPPASGASSDEPTGL